MCGGVCLQTVVCDHTPERCTHHASLSKCCRSPACRYVTQNSVEQPEEHSRTATCPGRTSQAHSLSGIAPSLYRALLKKILPWAAHRAPAVLIAIMELDKELADGANDGMVAPQLHVELIIGVKAPAAALGVHHMHHRHMPDLTMQKVQAHWQALLEGGVWHQRRTKRSNSHSQSLYASHAS